MSNHWFNIRFGEKHFIWGPDGMSWSTNTFHTIERYKNPDTWKWFAIYTFFGKHFDE